MPVIALLTAMIPLGLAMETTGSSKLIADKLLEVGRSVSLGTMLAVLMGSVMLSANVLNHTAAAIMASPVAISLAQELKVAPDPFLMAVVIRVSCTFLTPVGHQSNTLVMAPGGYLFSDYWRVGLPLALVVIAVAVPAILWVWPL